MKNPEPGQWVVEHTTMSREKALKAIGVLQRIAWEPVPLDEWSEAEDGPRPTEKVWYIKNLLGEEIRWVNADFHVIPKDFDQYFEICHPDLASQRRHTARAALSA